MTPRRRPSWLAGSAARTSRFQNSPPKTTPGLAPSAVASSWRLISSRSSHAPPSNSSASIARCRPAAGFASKNAARASSGSGSSGRASALTAPDQSRCSTLARGRFSDPPDAQAWLAAATRMVSSISRSLPALRHDLIGMHADHGNGQRQVGHLVPLPQQGGKQGVVLAYCEFGRITANGKRRVAPEHDR